MRRAGNLSPGVVDFHALLTAARQAARGKRFSRSAARFLERAEFEVLALGREIVDGAEVVDLFEGLAVPLASLAALIAQKVLARDDVRRPQDRLDLTKLLEVASEDELAEAERLLGLIMARGYARRRGLVEDLRGLVDEIRRG